jgi:hypothetical protein
MQSRNMRGSILLTDLTHHLAASTRIGPFTLTSSGQVAFTLLGFTVPLTPGKR